MSVVTSCISTTMVLLLLGAVVAFVLVAHNFGAAVRENFSIEVLVKDQMDKGQLYGLQQSLKKQPYTLRLNYVSKEQTSQEMAEALDLKADDSFLEHNPLPQEFEVYLRAEYTTADSLARIVPELMKMDGVTEVLYPLEEIKGLDAVIPIVSLSLLVVALLLGFVSFALINNIIRLTVYSQRLSIHTMKLVGASWGFIRRPFLRRFVWIGVVSATVASVLIALVLHYFVLLNTYISTLVTSEVWWTTLVTVYLCGILLTLLCAWVSVNKYLKMNESQMMLE